MKKVTLCDSSQHSENKEICCLISDSSGKEVEYCFLQNWPEDCIEKKMGDRIIEVQQFESLSDFEEYRNERINLTRIISLTKRVTTSIK